MKQVKRILCLLLVLTLLAGCGSIGDNNDTTAPETSGAGLDTPTSVPEETTEPVAVFDLEGAIAQIQTLGESPDDNYRTWYEIFVYSFCDSNGDGYGDLQGVISKLDYIQEMGFNGIWFMPIHPSQSYHKYDVRDYYDIAPEYGTMADFEELMAECEKRDIHVILDLVVNHTGDDNEWFLTAADYLKSLPAGVEPDPAECKYVDYYTFSRTPGNGFHSIPGSEWYYEGMFSVHMPDLNLGNENVRADITDIMKFWLDKGVAGFRLDAAKEFYSGNVNANVEVLNWIQTTGESLKEDIYFVAEVWEGFNILAQYYTSGITSVFDFAFGNNDGKIMSVVRAAGNAGVVSTYATALEKADGAYSASNPEYIDAPFLSNHDVGRIAGFAGRDNAKTKLAGAMNLFMSGSAFVYYGEEIGMVGSGNDPSKRAPFVWNEARNNGTTTPPPECELPEEYPFGSLETQQADPYSVNSYYRQVIAIRNAIPAIARGKTTAETGLNVGCVSAFRKTWGDEQAIILMNIDTKSAQVDLSGYADWTVAATVCVDAETVSVDGTNVTMPAYGTVVLIPAK